MKTLEQLVTEFFADRTEAPIAECCEYVLKMQARGELEDRDRIWIERAQRRGLEVAINERFRALRFKLKGVSLRRLGVLINEQGEHAWVDLRRVLTAGTDEEKIGVAEHSATVIAEAIGMIREHRQIIVQCGAPARPALLRIDALLAEAFAPK